MDKRIILAGLCSYDNLGDQILIDTCTYLVNRTLKKINKENIKIEFIDLQKPIKNKWYSIIHLFYRITCRLTSNKDILDKFKYYEACLRYRKYFEEILTSCCALIFVGGAYLKYKSEDFRYSIRLLLKISDELNIPVMMNSVGIEGYEKNDFRCIRLKWAINRQCVKVITTRDDHEFLNKHFISNHSIVTANVADSALWIPECYKIFSITKKYDIGINMSYLNLFHTYQITDDNTFIELYKEIFKHLSLRGLSYRIFCNGKSEDYTGAIELCRILSIPQDTVLPRPESPLQLINQIGEFRAILPIRFHACVIAYALGIQSAGYIWNHKYDTFLKKSNMIEMFQPLKNVNVFKIVNDLQKIVEGNSSKNLLNEDKLNTLYYIERFLEKYV